MTEGETLLRLMEQDLAIARAAKALDELPEKTAILQLRHRLKEIEGVAVKAEAYVRRANAMVAKSAHEVEMVQAKIDDEQAKVLSGQVNDPKELANLTREIDALSRRKDQLEREELGLMEKVEAGEAQRTKVDAALEEGRAKEAELVELYKARGGEIQTEIARLRAARRLPHICLMAPSLHATSGCGNPSTAWRWGRSRARSAPHAARRSRRARSRRCVLDRRWPSAPTASASW